MKIEEFWSLIDATRTDDPFAHAEAIQAALEKQSAEDIVTFEKHTAELLTQSYNWELWGAAYLINGGCSDDGFDYFRGWLLTQRKTVFEAALKDPDSLADLPDLEDEVECEDVLYVASRAYEEVTGKEIPEVEITYSDLDEGWDFDDDDEMKSRYPKLFAKFCED